jgi:hypothetical protein
LFSEAELVQGVRIAVAARVAILIGDSVVGRALEALLQGLGYDTRLIEESTVDKPEDLGGTQLLLTAPAVSTETRARFLAAMRNTSATADIPVLTLTTAYGEELDDATRSVPWPCRMEDLKTEIEAALLPTASAEGSAS